MLCTNTHIYINKNTIFKNVRFLFLIKTLNACPCETRWEGGGPRVTTPRPRFSLYFSSFSRGLAKVRDSWLGVLPVTSHRVRACNDNTIGVSAGGRVHGGGDDDQLQRGQLFRRRGRLRRWVQRRRRRRRRTVAVGHRNIHVEREIAPRPQGSVARVRLRHRRRHYGYFDFII